MGDPNWQNPKWAVPATGEEKIITSLLPYARFLARQALDDGEDSQLFDEFFSNLSLVLLKAVREHEDTRGPSVRKHAMYRMRREIATCFNSKYARSVRAGKNGGRGRA